MLSPIDLVLSRLESFRKSGKGFKALCPAHSDRTPSLSLKEGEDGRVLLHCFAGCDASAVVQAIGLQMTDLFLPDHKSSVKRMRLPGINIRELQAATEFEKQVLFIVKADQAAGRAVSQLDWERAKLAAQRIADAKRIL